MADVYHVVVASRIRKAGAPLVCYPLGGEDGTGLLLILFWTKEKFIYFYRYV